MKKVRHGVFETNSSSVHTLTICTEDEYGLYTDGELLRCKFDWILKDTKYKGRKFVTREEAAEIEKAYLAKHGETYDDESIEEFVHDDFESYDDEDEYLECYEEHFVSPSGDKMVAFGRYGYDG